MSALNDKVAALPEIYQPIFGHPELAQNVSRACEDRLLYLRALHDSMQQQLQRPVRVLDLGCAQGYISLSLAARGANVVGVDFLPANVDVCSALAAEHPEWHARFEHARLEDFIGQLGEDSFDLVLGLSVFHHVVHEQGLPQAQQLLDRLAACVAIGAFELAQAGEPLYWGVSQPEDSRDLLRGFGFVHELAVFPTHLSDIVRPLYVASNRYWYLGGELQALDRAEGDSHALARGVHQSSRRYLFGGGRLAKLVRLDGALGSVNKVELEREIAVLGHAPQELFGRWPRLESSGLSAREGWLVRSMIDGELLLDLIMRGAHYEPFRVIEEVLDQLATLERHGQYHGDVRVWNVVIASTGEAVLIDYGAISKEPVDCDWPNDLFLAFFAFVHDVVARSVSKMAPIAISPFISPHNLPEPYAGWLAAFWARPRSEWSYKALREMLPADQRVAANADGLSLWLGAMERRQAIVGGHLRSQAEAVHQMANRHEALDQAVASLNGAAGVALEALRADIRGLTGRHDALDSTVASLNTSAGVALDSLRTDLGSLAERQRSELGSLAEWQRGELGRLSGEVDGLRHALERARGEFGKAQEQWLASEQERLRAQQELVLLRNSFSFHVTKPLRYMANILRKGRPAVARVVRPLWHTMVLHAWGRSVASVVCAPFPTLKARLHESITAHARSSGEMPVPVKNKELSAGSQWIHEQLQHGLKGRKSDKGD